MVFSKNEKEFDSEIALKNGVAVGESYATPNGPVLVLSITEVGGPFPFIVLYQDQYGTRMGKEIHQFIKGMITK